MALTVVCAFAACLPAVAADPVGRPQTYKTVDGRDLQLYVLQPEGRSRATGGRRSSSSTAAAGSAVC